MRVWPNCMTWLAPWAMPLKIVEIQAKPYFSVVSDAIQPFT
jgi:hypothetical protein